MNLNIIWHLGYHNFVIFSLNVVIGCAGVVRTSNMSPCQYFWIGRLPNSEVWFYSYSNKKSATHDWRAPDTSQTDRILDCQMVKVEDQKLIRLAALRRRK